MDDDHVATVGNGTRMVAVVGIYCHAFMAGGIAWPSDYEIEEGNSFWGLYTF